MQLRIFKLKFRRNLRRRKQQASSIGSTADESLEKYLMNRLNRIIGIRRFLIGWLSLIFLISILSVIQTRSLQPMYKQLSPVDGGIFREGVIGTFTNVNPVFAQNQFDASVSKLVFSGLFKYDKSGKLIPDMAKDFSIDTSGTEYIVNLKHDLKWHDGKAVTARDVVFTYQLIQNPASKSFLASSWRGVVVSAIGDYSIKFKLDNALGGFPNSLTNGIIPSHSFVGIDASQIRSSKFNNESPIGCGPFKFDVVHYDKNNSNIKSAVVALAPYDNYHSGKPKLEKFILKSYPNESAMHNAFNNHSIDLISGLDVMPDDLDKAISSKQILLSSEVMVFFRNSQDILKDVNVRKALVLAINKDQTLKTLNYTLMPVGGPILNRQINFAKDYNQPAYNIVDANKLLDEAGWKKSSDTGLRIKDGHPLQFSLISSDGADFVKLSIDLQKQWRAIGVDVNIQNQSEEELQSTVTGHTYDSLLYSISLGADPDVYVYWHSSQSDIRSSTRLNLSEYKSSVADKALEAGRTRTDPTLRALKYKPFLDAWQKDFPALALYEQQFLVVYGNNFNGLENTYMHSSTDRYSDVNHWTIKKSMQIIKP